MRGAPASSVAHVERLLAEVRACRRCDLPLGPRPMLQLDPRARVLIAGQAPGRRAHALGIPFRDASGDRLRAWMGIDEDVFYDPARVAILPMGFCYPGTDASGDAPPRPECAATWRRPLLAVLPRLELILVIGRWAVDYHLGAGQKGSLTDTVRAWREFWPAALPLPHPSPRNNLWLKRNPWFEREILPALRARLRRMGWAARRRAGRGR